MQAGQQYAVDVQQRFYPGRGLFLEKLPLARGKAEIVVGVVARDAASSKPLEFLMFRRGKHHQR